MAKLTPKRVCLLYQRCDLALEQVVDLRANRGRQSPLAALLRLMVVGIACGQRKLRDLEALCAAMPARLRRFVGLRGRPVSDTTLYEMLSRTPPQFGFDQALWHQVRADIDRKAIQNDLFAGGVLSVDGKCAGWGKGPLPNRLCQKGFFNYGTDASWRLLALRACLTSCVARPVLDQVFLSSEGEATAFGPLFARVVERFPRLFRYVTADAGIISAENAHIVAAAGKHYLFALKGNLKQLYHRAIDALRDRRTTAQYAERYRGQWVIRELCTAPLPPHVHFPSAAQFVCVTTTRIDKQGNPKVHNRFFVTSIDSADMSADRLLKLVRLHWGIENGANWTADVVFDEDSHCPCKTGWGLQVQSWLNLLAHNLVAVFRSRLAPPGHRPGWRSVLRTVYLALIHWQPAQRATVFNP